MSIKSDKWIRRMAQEQGMISPFEPAQVRHNEHGKVISYGTSSYGYDVRCADEFKVFTNINSVIVDPKNFDTSSFVDVKANVCIIPPNSFALARTVEYFKIPRDVLTVCLGKSTYARCFRGDTQVALVDGSAPTLEEMARRADNGECFWGYSLGEFGRVMVTQLESPRFIGRDSLLEITLDDGKMIHCTPDHEFILRDGRRMQAGNLRPNDSLMPLYRDVFRGYEMVYQPINHFIYPTHRLADEWNLRHGIYAEMANSHRHHLDFNRLNNNPYNIVRMDASEHLRLHNSHHYNETFDPNEHGLAIKEAFARLKQNSEWQENFSQSQQQKVIDFWQDEKYAGHRAARLLNCDRSVFRRFPETIAAFRGQDFSAQTVRNHKIHSIKTLAGDHDVYCLTVPEAGNFALEAGVFVSNCGIIVNVTPLEPEWSGHVTLEFSNTTPLPAKIYANEGVAQMLFFGGDEVCETSYKDRGGKYQGQTGVTLPKA